MTFNLRARFHSFILEIGSFYGHMDIRLSYGIRKCIIINMPFIFIIFNPISSSFSPLPLPIHLQCYTKQFCFYFHGIYKQIIFIVYVNSSIHKWKKSCDNCLFVSDLFCSMWWSQVHLIFCKEHNFPHLGWKYLVSCV